MSKAPRAVGALPPRLLRSLHPASLLPRGRSRGKGRQFLRHFPMSFRPLRRSRRAWERSTRAASDRAGFRLRHGVEPGHGALVGTIRFAGPFRDYDGVLIIDHGGGWMSLLVNVSSELKQGDKVRLGQPLGRALGPLQVELSQNGRRISPALIAGSSQNLSKNPKGG